MSADLANWPRLRNVLLETLRLYPVGRRVTHLHRTAFRVVGSANRLGAPACAVPDHCDRDAASDACRPRHDRAGLRADVPARTALMSEKRPQEIQKSCARKVS